MAEELLIQLAEKLGMTVEYLWSALIRQAGIEAISCTVVAIIAGVFCFAFTKTALWGAKTFDDEGQILVPILCGLMAMAALCVVVSYGHAAITAAFNPEYWALMQVLP